MAALLYVAVLLISNARQVVGKAPTFVEEPEDAFVVKNDPVTLNCKADGEPKPAIGWFRDGKPVSTSTDDPASHRMLLPSGQLFFLKVIHSKNNKPDVGTYYCVATNPLTNESVTSKNASLAIAVLREDFRTNPRDTVIGIGDTTVLECRGPKGTPEPTVEWQRNGAKVSMDSRLRVDEKGNLIISEAKTEDSGKYTCHAHNKVGERVSKAAFLEVKEKPRFIEKPEDVLVDEGQDATFNCQATGDPMPTIVWKRNGEGVLAVRGTLDENSNSLKIKNVKISDEGEYICHAKNSVGLVKHMAQLTVHSHPSFLVTPQDKTVGIGRKVTLRCVVKGNPPPAVYWSREDSDVLMFPRHGHGRLSVHEDGTLVIDRVRSEDAGEFVCQALNVAGTAYATAKVTVKAVDPRPPPIIHQGPLNQTLPVSGQAMLHCHTAGKPIPRIRWFKDGLSISKDNGRFTVLDSGALKISNILKTDSGIYTCKAFSETGETSWSAALKVESPSDSSVIFHRTPEPSTFPGPPSKPIAMDVTTNSIRLSWKSNANHGASPVISYTIEYFSRETDQGWVVASDAVKPQSFTVRSLQPNTSYMFLVRARNGHGLSLPSTLGGPYRTKGSSKSSPSMQEFDVAKVSEKLSGQVIHMKQPTALSSTAIQIFWEIMKSANFIQGFHIKYRVMPDPYRHMAELSDSPHHHHVDFTIDTVTSGSATTYVLRHLRRFTWYEIRVQPFFHTIEGHESNTVRIRTYEDVPTAAPQNVRGEMIGNSTLRLQWSPPPEEHKNGELRGYKIYCLGNETRFHRNITANASMSSVLIRHLAPGMVYHIQVAAFNKRGLGVRSKALVVGASVVMLREPWFIATLIGTIGGTLWFLLCVLSAWLYKRKQERKKMEKNGIMTVPVHKADDTTRFDHVSNHTPLLSVRHHGNDASNQGNHICVASCCHDDSSPSENDLQQQGYSAVPRYHILEAVHQSTLNGYMTAAPDDATAGMNENLYNTPTAPSLSTFYNKNATAGLRGGIEPCGPYATTTLVAENPLQGVMPPADGNAFRPIQPLLPNGSGSSDSGLRQDMSGESDKQTEEDRLRAMINSGQPVLFLPPPPEHPPPSDIGTPPDSPNLNSHGKRGNEIYQPPVFRQARVAQYSDGEYGGGNHHGSSRRTPIDDRAGSPKCRAVSPRSQLAQATAGSGMYSPRYLSEPERGPTPPARGYRLVPISDQEMNAIQQHQHRTHYSDTEGVPIPPLRAMQHSPPPPAPNDDPCIDRACQSSLQGFEIDPADLDSDVDANRAQRGSPVSSLGDLDVAANTRWPETVETGSSCTSTSSDGSFFAEADFASAVAKAAELSGLTVVGSTVTDPQQLEQWNNGRKGKKRRERAKRPSSPGYSTDSNYSCVQMPPHRPYPKSERRRQIQDYKSKPTRGPATKAKPVLSPGGSVPGTPVDKRMGVRTNPLAAFDHVAPIV